MTKYSIILFLVCCFFACDDIVEVKDISGEVVTILAPANEVTIDSTKVNFSWENLDEVVEYRIQVASPNFEMAQQIMLDSLVTTNNHSSTLVNGVYQWRIKGINTEFETAYTVSNFTVEE